MFKRKSLFIIGAAASEGFPLGGDLKEKVAERLFFRTERGAFQIGQAQTRVFQAARDKGISDRRLVEIGRVVREGVNLSVSIDNFLELKSAEQDLVDCCKLAIADIILSNETKRSGLRSDIVRPPQLNDFVGTWHQIFAQICFQSCTSKSDISEALSRFTVISFNYDRCIEQFIRIAVMRLYSVPYDEAADLAKSVLVFHPYGSLGSLPGSSNAPRSLAFGQEYNMNLSVIASHLKTFTEQTLETSIIEQIREATANSTLITFLGFGYHKPNLEILAPIRQNTRRKVVGTAKGLSDFARGEITGNLAHLFRPWHGDSPLTEARVTLEDKTCFEFMDHFRLALAD